MANGIFGIELLNGIKQNREMKKDLSSESSKWERKKGVSWGFEGISMVKDC